MTKSAIPPTTEPATIPPMGLGADGFEYVVEVDWIEVGPVAGVVDEIPLFLINQNHK